MKGNLRKKQSILSLGMVIIGLVCLCGITANIRRLEAADNTLPYKEVEIQEIQDTNFELDTEKIYSEVKRTTEEATIEDIARQLVAHLFLKEVTFKDKGDSVGVTLYYAASEHELSLTKAKKDQMVLINSSILMSLYPNLDAIKFEVIRDNEYYKKVIYRLDLNDYFGVRLEDINNLSTFERIAGEFMDLDQVNSYWNSKHPYDSFLGEDVEEFYKYEFPAQWGEEYPYIDENLEKQLADNYGYRLFIEGLKFDHPLMNYYCAYRLIEYYGNKNLDEIILELASCKNKTSDSRVKAACDFAIHILTANLDENEVEVFTRYEETALGGGQKLYVLTKDKLTELARWEGKKAGGFKVLSIAPDQKSVLCEVMTKDESYLYHLPIDETGHYIVTEEGVIKNGIKLENELISGLQNMATGNELEMTDQSLGRSLSMGEIKYEWLYETVLGIEIKGGLNYIKVGNMLMSRDDFDKEFNTAYLLKALGEAYRIDEEQMEVYQEGQMERTLIRLNGQQIACYEYKNEVQMSRALEEWKQRYQGEDETASLLSKGKIFITYNGEDLKLQKELKQIME